MTASPETDEDPSTVPAATLLSAIMLPLFLAMVDQTIVATALPAITAALSGFDRLAWIVVAYLGAAAVAAPVYGRLGDAFGRRRLMTLALVVSLAGSLFCAIASTFELLIAARVVQGFGGGGLVSLSYALVRQFVPARTNARYQGYMAAIALCASTLGPVLGGLATEHLGWRSIFLLNVPVSMVALALLYRLPPRRSPVHAMHFDWIGLGLLSVGIFAFLLLVESMRHSADLSLVVAGFASTGVCSVCFVRRASRSRDPLLPLMFFHNPTIRLSEFLAMFHGALYVSLMTFVPVYLGVARDASAADIGLMLLPMTLGVGVGSIATSLLVSRTGLTMLFPSIALTAGTAILVTLAFWMSHMSTIAVVLWFSVVAAAMGTVMGVVQMTVMAEAGGKMLGVASASVTLSRSIGAACGTALVGMMMSVLLSANGPKTEQKLQAGLVAVPRFAREHLQSDLDWAFHGVFLTIAAFCAGACVLAWRVPRRTI